MNVNVQLLFPSKLYELLIGIVDKSQTGININGPKVVLININGPKVVLIKMNGPKVVLTYMNGPKVV